MKNKMEEVLTSLNKRFATVQAGRANPALLDGVMVDYYGTPTDLRSLATISIPEARQIMIKPFDKGSLQAIERAIFEANLGLTPGNDGEAIRINVPALTEETRKEYTKQARTMAEEAKIRVRNIRHDEIEDLKKMEMPEDEEKKEMDKIQELVNEYNKKIDEKLKEKETDLMSV